MLLYVDKIRRYADGISQARVIDDNLNDVIITTDTFLLSGSYYDINEVNIISQKNYTVDRWQEVRA